MKGALPVIEMWMVDIADERGHLHRRRMIGYWTTKGAFGADLSADEYRQLKLVS